MTISYYHHICLVGLLSSLSIRHSSSTFSETLDSQPFLTNVKITPHHVLSFWSKSADFIILIMIFIAIFIVIFLENKALLKIKIEVLIKFRCSLIAAILDCRSEIYFLFIIYRSIVFNIITSFLYLFFYRKTHKLIPRVMINLISCMTPRLNVSAMIYRGGKREGDTYRQCIYHRYDIQTAYINALRCFSATTQYILRRKDNSLFLMQQ